MWSCHDYLDMRGYEKNVERIVIANRSNLTDRAPNYPGRPRTVVRLA